MEDKTPTPEDLERYDDAVLFRGKYLEYIIALERNIESCIASFFNKYHNDKNLNLPYFLSAYLLGNKFVALSFKIDILQQIIYLEIGNPESFNPYFGLMRRLNELRTFVAHYSINHEFKGGISFYKIITKYKVHTPNGKNKYWGAEEKSVDISKKTELDIYYQLKVANEFVMYIETVLNNGTGNNKDHLDLINNLYKGTHTSLISSEGVFTLPLTS